MKKILLDTNFLLIPFQFKVDIFSEFERICFFNYKLFVLDKSLNELKKIHEKQKGKNKHAAEFALKLIKLKNINIIKTTEKIPTDDLILKKSDKKEYVVATQDKILKKQLKLRQIPIIILRQKKKLELEGKI